MIELQYLSDFFFLHRDCESRQGEAQVGLVLTLHDVKRPGDGSHHMAVLLQKCDVHICEALQLQLHHHRQLMFTVNGSA